MRSLVKLERGEILGCKLDLCDYLRALEEIRDMVAAGIPEQIVTLNPEMILYAGKNLDFRALINQAALITADGVSVVWAARKMGYPITERVTGIDLTLRICQAAAEAGWRLYLLGAAPGVAKQAGDKLLAAYPGLVICGCHDGYFTPLEEADLVADIKSAKPDILLVGMGSPRQEFWIQENKTAYAAAVSIGIGGSFDVIAGIKKRAPNWMIACKLEWLYRLLLEPKRIKRQAKLPLFVVRVLRSKKTVLEEER